LIDFLSVRTIFIFRRRQAQFNELLSSNSNLNSNRYFRLMCLAAIEVICTVPLSIYEIYLNVTLGVISPWISWANTHAEFSRVDQIPAILWRNNPVLASSLELSRWLVVVCGFVFFAFFGFADEAQKHYRLALQSVAKRVGYSTNSMGSSSGTSSFGYVHPLSFG
jgi:pheromone a factor receptor